MAVKSWSQAMMTVSLLGVSLPTFLIGILLILVFAVTFKWFPSFGRGEVTALEDIEFVDHRTLFDAVSSTDTYDLAKLAASAGDQAVVDKLFSVMTEARKKEVSWVMRRDLKIDPAEVEDIEQRFLQTIRELKAASGQAPARMSREA